MTGGRASFEFLQHNLPQELAARKHKSVRIFATTPFSPDVPINEVLPAGHVAGAIGQEQNSLTCDLVGLVKRSVRKVVFLKIDSDAYLGEALKRDIALLVLSDMLVHVLGLIRVHLMHLFFFRTSFRRRGRIEKMTYRNPEPPHSP